MGVSQAVTFSQDCKTRSRPRPEGVSREGRVGEEQWGCRTTAHRHPGATQQSQRGIPESEEADIQTHELTACTSINPQSMAVYEILLKQTHSLIISTQWYLIWDIKHLSA